jgi:uncharacterized protein involved in exopolysaccharide biosynthesis
METIPDRELERVANANVSISIDNRDYLHHEQAMARVRLVWNERKFLFRVTIYGLLVAAMVAFLIPKRYESTTLLMPPDDQSGSGFAMAAALAGKMSGGLAGVAGDVLGLKSSGDLFIGILKSRTALDDLIVKFDLQKVYGYRDMQSTRRSLSENTAISEDRKSGIITITVTDRVPQRAAAMAQEYVAELNLVVSQLSTSSAHRERVFLEGRLAQVKTDLESAEKDFSQFASKNGTIDIKEQGRAMVEGAASLQGQLIAAQSELQGLKQIYADNNVRVRSLQARVVELQNQLQQLGGKEGIVSDATSSQNQNLYPSIRKLPLLGVPYADLYRRMMVEEAVFESLTQEYELAKVAEAKEIPSVKVLDPANIPEHKSFPPRLVIMLLSVFLCLASGVVWVLAKAAWNEMPAQYPQKLLVRDILQTVNNTMPWAPPNGSRIQAASHAVWVRVVGSHSSADRSKSESKYS